ERILPKLLIQAGIGLMVVGIFLLYRVVSLTITIGQMAIPLGIFGVGMGLLMAHLVNLILSSVDANDSPEASGVNNAMDQLGNSLGTAVVGSLLMAFFLGNVVDTVLKDHSLQVTPQERTQIITQLEDARETITEEEYQAFYTQLSPDIQQGIETLKDNSIVTAMEDTLIVMGALLIIMFILATFMPKKERAISPAERVPDIHEGNSK
ncbi:MAG: MFS transporter, partial [Chloroflexi bacterium]|nr:MFS transporter [Chloroflexota bacterium]